MRKIKTNLLNPVSAENVEFKKNIFLTLENGKITSIEAEFDGEFEDKTDLICCPGFIDTHVHLSQFYIRGSHSPNLLHWLNTYTFQEEKRSRNEDYARKVAEDFFVDLVSKGTTTSVIYTAPFKPACDIAFQVAEEKKIRAIIGMTMMDMESPEYLQQKPLLAFDDSVDLFHKWNKKSDLLEYIFTPRFALTCSSELMQITGDFARNENAFIQTHLSENKEEIKRALELFPKYKSYTEIYAETGILSPKTILGHVIHVDENELQLLKETNSKIAHCPDSNFFLKSGMFSWQKIKESEIDFALASDVGGGSSLNMLNVMKMAAFRQNDLVVSPQELFYRGTLGAAKILGKEEIIGSIQPEKDADLVFLKLSDFQKYNETELLSKLIYTHEDVEVVETLVQGKQVFK
ncbi:MAG: guanine deaminase [Candidatus Cloacimonetes bacterium]|nr:guanine deaminase [Candidatus Cloacimonadota bacterium]MCF7813869.1 guanine deaminase [Candidatus Cloacimonadota bacterium]MCF7869451.1 guanine deaminase [Candidatus Cloacimonadota bacterium]MCF7883981.1 guanine deaminase [Candidatus Cloacimonadota bacterium]